MRTIFCILGVILLIVGCKFRTTRINQEKDRKEAEIITDQFYEIIKGKDFRSTLKLFSDSIFSSSEKEQVLEALISTSKKLGSLKEVSLIKWETQIAFGSNPSSEYYFVYKNKYEKHDAIEAINLRKEDDYIKIIGYDIKSKGFIE